MMKKFSKVIVEIVKITKKGKCNFGHKKGEKFIFTHMGCQKPLCIYAQASLMPAVEVLLHGGKFPWKRRKGAVYWGCSHPGNLYPNLGQVIFKLKTLND